MNRAKTFSLSLTTIALAFAAACGSTDPGANPDGGSGGGGGGTSCQLPSGALLPWKLGNKWSYKVTELGQVSQKITTIEVAELVGGTGPNSGKMAFKVVTKKGEKDQTISWQGPDGDRIVRYREQSFNATTGALELEEHWAPHKLHIDGSSARMMKDASWLESYQETKRPAGGNEATATAMDRWSVLADCETVQVLDKSWNAIKLQKAGGTTLKTYWYVPGIGKVKESGGQTEELVEYEVTP